MEASKDRPGDRKATRAPGLTAGPDEHWCWIAMGTLMDQGVTAFSAAIGRDPDKYYLR